MNNTSNNKETKIEDMSMKEIFTEIKKRDSNNFGNKAWKIIKEVLLFWPKMLGAMFGINKETVSSYSKHGNRKDNGDFRSYHPHPHSPQAFRESYRRPFNPYDYDVANQVLYYKSIDGIGDHDCGHDHDEH